MRQMYEYFILFRFMLDKGSKISSNRLQTFKSRYIDVKRSKHIDKIATSKYVGLLVCQCSQKKYIIVRKGCFRRCLISKIESYWITSGHKKYK